MPYIAIATAVVLGYWQPAVICPIFKNGDPWVFCRRRCHPVSLTSVVRKAFERFLKRAMLSFLIQCKALSGWQHGFLPHRSCHSNLLIREETTTRLMDDGNAADGVYIDFAKAFDSLYQRFVLAKLELFGLCDKVVRWIRSYLTGRTYRV